MKTKIQIIQKGAVTFIKRNIIIIRISIVVLALFASCSPPSPTPPPTTTAVCNTVNTTFQQLYAATFALTGTFECTTCLNFEIHEYQFKSATNIAICSIRYQSQTAIAGVNYKIEILDALNTVVYSVNTVFSSTATSYISIPPVSIIAGQTYTMRRTMLNSAAGGGFTNLGGRLLNKNATTLSFPFTLGTITILGGDFRQTGSTAIAMVNKGLPFIDFTY